MGYINVDPITKKVKEYKNMAEWQADVEKATSDPKPKPIKKMTFAEASKKLREEAGIDLRDSSEKRQAEVDSLIEKKVAEGISAALARQQAQATQSPTVKHEVHSGPFAEANAALARIHEMQKGLGLKPPKACSCTHEKHSQKAEPAVHSAYGVGPVMPCQRVTWAEAQKRLQAAGVEI